MQVLPSQHDSNGNQQRDKVHNAETETKDFKLQGEMPNASSGQLL